MRFLNPTLCVLLAVLTVGCASSGGGSSASDKGVTSMMARWKGHRATEAVGMWGMPDSIDREGALGVLHWKADPPATTTAWTPPMMERSDGRQPWPTRCHRVLMVDAQEIIQQARWFGSECSTDPADYAPPGVASR